jgi:hypothetical protein
MTFIFLVTILTLNGLFFLKYKNLLYILILLEVLGFLCMIVYLYLYNIIIRSYILLLIIFVFFVVEGVLGLVGLILLISSAGADYLGLSSQSM